MSQLVETNQKGKIPSWGDVIAVAEMQTLPVTSMLAKRTRPTQVVHNYQAKKYRNKGFAGQRDGQDVTDFNFTAREELQAVAMLLSDGVGVSKFAQEAKIAGQGKTEFAVQQIDSAIALKRAMERAVCSNVDCVLDDGATVGNQTRGFFSWLSPTAQAKYPVPDGYRPAAATQFSGKLSDFKEAGFLAQCRESYKVRRGQSDMTGVLGIDLKAKFTDFRNRKDDVTGTVTVQKVESSGDSPVYINTVDELRMDTGRWMMLPSTYLYSNQADGSDSAYTHKSGFGFDMKMAGLAYTQKPTWWPLEQKGGGVKGFMDAIFLLMIDNPQPGVTILCNAD